MYKLTVHIGRTSLANGSRRSARLMPSANVNDSPKALKMFHSIVPTRLRQAAALTIALLLCALPASAGIRVQGTQGLTMTGTDGIYFDNTSGLTMTGTDKFLTFGVNGIFIGSSTQGLTMTGTDGLTMTGTDGQKIVTVDGVSYTGANNYTATRADGLTMTGADGLTMTGTDGLTMTGTDGTVWQVNSIVFRQPMGITLTDANGLTMTGTDGLTMTGTDGLTMTGTDGLTTLGVGSVHVDSAGQVVVTKTDGTVVNAPTNGLTMTGTDTLAMTGAWGITASGVQGLVMTAADGLPPTPADGVAQRTGLLSLDAELALKLDAITDDSNVNAVVVYHHPITDADIADLQSIGVRGGTRYRALPMVVITASKCQIDRIGDLPNVRTIYGARTLQWSLDTSQVQNQLSQIQSRVSRVRVDADLQNLTGGSAPDGSGVTVALIDTGVDSTHPDITGRVVRNVKLADLQGASVAGFNPPANVEGLSDTDQLSGHGTFVSGVIAGSGASSSGKYAGYAPKARVVSLSAGDASLLNVLAGFDYLLTHPELSVRAVNCSFSANTAYDDNDPVNVATRMLVERGVNVVFSAGNSGPGMRTLNPYAAAPWVISVGALDARGRLADFSSRGDFGSRNFRPTLVAPGTNVVSLRASGTNLTGTTNAPNDAQQLSSTEAAYYTTASGTSFSAPQVAGTIALMLQANPNLTTAEVRDILQRTATPLPPYYQHEVGAGALNAHAAVLQAAFPQRQIGLFRAVLNRGQVQFVKDPTQVFEGTVYPGGACDIRLSVPANAVFASTDIAWGPFTSVNDLALYAYDPAGKKVTESNFLNLPGLTGKRERTLVDLPAQGQWRARITHTLSASATAQTFKGVFETAHIEYAPMPDLAGLDAQTVDYIRQAVRALAMSPDAGGYFRPTAAATRGELAAALIAGARVPQYIPQTPSFIDVSDSTTLDFVESTQSLFPDVYRGGTFRPDDSVTRLVAAIVLVRAAGLQQEAESKAGAILPYTDAQTIPSNMRGYVKVATDKGLMTAEQQFNPDAPLTRADLARAIAAIVQMNVQP